MIKEMLLTGEPNHLNGFENNTKDGTGCYFNFINSNGQRSKQKGKGLTYYTHMMPEGAQKMIRSANIHDKTG